jgi:hypothetical protein
MSALPKETARFLAYNKTYLQGEKTYEGYATSLPDLQSTPSGTATKTIGTRRAKNGESTMSPEALARSKAQRNNPNQAKKKNGS